MEDSIKKQSVNKYKRAQFQYNFVVCALTSLITCLFFSYTFGFPSVQSLISSLHEIHLLADAKCFFFIGNAIVFILVGESKLARSSHSSRALDMYNEYLARSRSYHNRLAYSCVQLKDKKSEEKRDESIKKKEILEERREMKVGKNEEIVKRKKMMGEKGGQTDMPREELNKRVEAFIKRVNKQRFLEAKLVDHSRV